MTDAGFYREHGYLHVRGVFEAAEVDAMRAAIERILETVAGTANDENHAWSAAEKETVLKDPSDAPLTKDGVEEHVNWGQGLMVAGRNPEYWQRRPRFKILAA